MEIIPDKRKLVGLVEQAYEGKICLPDFQRDFVCPHAPRYFSARRNPHLRRRLFGGPAQRPIPAGKHMQDGREGLNVETPTDAAFPDVLIN